MLIIATTTGAASR